ncbi:hypothetical protein SLE2022_305020 [Rubroshorea leprosula]
MATPKNNVFVSSQSVISIQELLQEPLKTLPQNYVLSKQEPPTPLPHANQLLPTIDMNRFASMEEFHLELHKLQSACQHWGFFQLVNHGVSTELLEKLKHEMERFFKLPLEEKMKFKVRAGEVEGYGSSGARPEGKLDWADRFYMLTNPIYRRKPYLFPELPSSLRSTLDTYMSELQKLGMELLGLIAKAIKIDVREMKEIFEDGMQSMRMTYYPPCPQPELVIGFTPHSDATGITILNQVNGVDGLQIKRDGIWYPVSFLPDALVVNVGDVLEILSNGIYHSIEHRVAIHSEKERMSIAFFINPKFEAEVGPLPSLINSQKLPLYKRMGMEEYVKGLLSHKLDGKTYLNHMRVEP